MILPFNIPTPSALTIKLIVGGIIGAILIGTVAFTIHDIKTKAFNAGVASSEQLHQKALDAANAANRQKETELQADINDYAKQFESLSAVRHQSEAKVATQIEAKIAATPNCDVDPEIISLRNAVRAGQ
jgi:hypothetical protein